MMNTEKHYSDNRFWKVAFVTAAIAVPIFVLATFEDLFIILVVSFTLTFVLKPSVDYIENLGAARWLAIVIVFTGLGSIVTALLFMVLPEVTKQITHISTAFSKEQLTFMLNDISTQISHQVPFLRSEAIRENMNSALVSFGNTAGNSLSNLLGTAASMAIVPFITFFLLNDYYTMQKTFIRKMPNKYFEMTLNIIYKIEDQLSKYIRGTVIESLIIAVLYTIAYYFMGIKYATVLGLIGGITNIIPFAGPFIGGIPTLLISIVQFGDLRMFLPIIITTLVVQQVDQMAVQPAVFSKIMNIHPLTMFLVILLGNELLGMMGMILAIPIYTVLFVTAKETNWGLKNYRITHV
jgi:predicted PurR-regulated permease PerM